jgi:hypothetical protein
MRENNKEILFARAFSLMLTHNIGDLTLGEVEKSTGFTRGAIFQSLFYGSAFQAAIAKDFDSDNLKTQMMEYYGSLCKKGLK